MKIDWKRVAALLAALFIWAAIWMLLRWETPLGWVSYALVMMLIGILMPSIRRPK